MAKLKRSKVPTLLVFAVADRAEEVDTNLFTLHRMWDTVSLPRPLRGLIDTPDAPPPGIELTVFARLFGGSAGTYQTRLDIARPDRRVIKGKPLAFTTKGGFFFHQTHHRVQMAIDVAGVYLFNLALDGQHVAQYPIKVVYT